MKYREIIRKLAAMGCRELPGTGSGSHRKWFNPATTGGIAMSSGSTPHW